MCRANDIENSYSNSWWLKTVDALHELYMRITISRVHELSWPPDQARRQPREGIRIVATTPRKFSILEPFQESCRSSRRSSRTRIRKFPCQLRRVGAALCANEDSTVVLNAVGLMHTSFANHWRLSCHGRRHCRLLASCPDCVAPLLYVPCRISLFAAVVPDNLLCPLDVGGL